MADTAADNYAANLAARVRTALNKHIQEEEQQDVVQNDLSEAKRHALLTSQRTTLLAPLPHAVGPIFDLSHALQAAFRAELNALGPGSVIDNSHAARDPDSYARLDAAVRSLKGKYASHETDWQQYVKYNKEHYVRHLIDATDEFQLILICWAPGQVSRVHSHGHSHGWVTALSGSVEEIQYDTDPNGSGSGTPRSDKLTVPGVVSVQTPCPHLQATKSTVLHPPGTTYINDHIALHSVGCTKEAAAGAVTLHLYAPPIRRVKLYEPDQGRVLVRVPGFATVRGVPVPP